MKRPIALVLIFILLCLFVSCNVNDTKYYVDENIQYYVKQSITYANTVTEKHTLDVLLLPLAALAYDRSNEDEKRLCNLTFYYCQKKYAYLQTGIEKEKKESDEILNIINTILNNSYNMRSDAEEIYKNYNESKFYLEQNDYLSCYQLNPNGSCVHYYEYEGRLVDEVMSYSIDKLRNIVTIKRDKGTSVFVPTGKYLYQLNSDSDGVLEVANNNSLSSSELTTQHNGIKNKYCFKDNFTFSLISSMGENQEFISGNYDLQDNIIKFSSDGKDVFSAILIPGKYPTLYDSLFVEISETELNNIFTNEYDPSTFCPYDPYV